MDYSYWRQARYDNPLSRQFRMFHGQFSDYRETPFVAYIIPVVNPTKLHHFEKQKSKAQKLRDQRRRQRFLESKSVCAAMPFCDVSNDELSKIMPKLSAHTCDSNQDSVEVTKLQIFLETALTTVDQLQVENRKLQDNEFLNSRLSEEQIRNRTLEKKLLSETEQIQKLQYEIERERQRCCIYQEDMQSQTEELEREKLQNIQHEGYILSLEADINELVRYKRQLEVFKAKESQKCRKCGRIDGHSLGECDANKVVCRNCRKRGHLTKFCEFVCRTCGMEEFHPAKQCPALSATCMLCRVRGHPQKTKACIYI